MQAALLYGKEDIRLESFDLPPLHGHDLLLRIRSCGICGSDLHFFHGDFPPPSVCPGHEISGEAVVSVRDLGVVRESDDAREGAAAFQEKSCDMPAF